MAGTLAETELKLRLYHGPARFDLIVKDYQGEHVTLGSDEPIQEFFADCDAVLLCLDPEGSADPAERRRRQQEVENLLERYIERSDDLQHRPAGRPAPDQVRPGAGRRQAAADGRGRRRADDDPAPLGAVRRAAGRRAVRDDPARPAAACARRGDLRRQLVRPGRDGQPARRPSSTRSGLEGPLGWLAEQLEARDRAQMEWLWDLAPDDLPRLERCVAAYERRYPRSNRSYEFRARLKALGAEAEAAACGESLAAAAAVAGRRWPATTSGGSSSASAFERDPRTPRPRSRAAGPSCSPGTRRSPLFWPALARAGPA